MAEFIRAVVSITTMDGVLRPSVTSYYVALADAQAYWAAADDAARAATDVGLLISRYLAMTDAAFVSSNVGFEAINDPVTNPGDTVLRGNKLSFSARSGGRGLVTTIPARKTGTFTQSTDSLQISLTTPAAMAFFVTAVNNTVKDAFGNDVTLVAGSVVD